MAFDSKYTQQETFLFDSGKLPDPREKLTPLVEGKVLYREGDRVMLRGLPGSIIAANVTVLGDALKLSYTVRMDRGSNKIQCWPEQCLQSELTRLGEESV